MNEYMATHVMLMDEAFINAHPVQTQGIGSYLPLAEGAAQLLKHPVPAALRCKPEPSLDKNRTAYAIRNHDSSFARAFAIYKSCL